MHFYPRPPCGGRRVDGIQRIQIILISIHALRAEGDTLPAIRRCDMSKFLSTPSVRRATTVVAS